MNTKIMKNQSQIISTARYMNNADLKQVLVIEEDSFDYPWDQDEFISVMKKSSVSSHILELNERVIAYYIYDLQKTKIEILNIAVDKPYRRKGVASQIVNNITDRLDLFNLKYVSITVAEHNLLAQLFFKNCGFKYIKTFTNHYEDYVGDAYFMSFKKSK